jgi:pantoate--beta-alanine ligase
VQIITSPYAMQELRKTIQGSVGFVPTMGALHDGHISLIKQARSENETVIVSVFVNPTQFLKGEDLDKYPKRVQADTKICELCKVDYLFLPQIDDMYQNDEVLVKAPHIKSYILEGQKRPGHFDGVLQIVLKLLGLTQPTHAYFGKKDAQQLVLIEQMVKNFYINTTIVRCDIKRENDGLALSSRNVYLNEQQRKEALAISKALYSASQKIANGELTCTVLKEHMQTIMQHLDIEYIAFVNRNFDAIETIELKNSIILIAVKIQNTRLIDNIWI